MPGDRPRAWLPGQGCTGRLALRGPGRLVRVEAPVGGLEELLHGGALSREVSGARADSEAVGEPLPEPGDEGIHVGRARGGQDRRELVAADPSADIGLAERPRERRGERSQEPVALLMAVAVVRQLEVVEVEEDERDAAAVATRPGGFAGELRVERAVIEEAGERVAARAVCELGRHALHVAHEAAVDGRPGLRLAVPLEDATEHEELGGDLGRCEPEALALQREIGGGRERVVVLLERGDERGQRPELTQPPEPLQRGHGAGRERLVDALDGKIPGRQPHDPVHASQSRESVG